MEETVREALKVIFEALKTGNVERFAQFIAPEVVWEMPGRSVFSGEHRGPTRALGLFFSGASSQATVFGHSVTISESHPTTVF